MPGTEHLGHVRGNRAAPPSPAESFDFWPYLRAVGGLLGPANVVMQLSLPGVGHGVIESTVTSGQAMRHPFKRGRTTFTYLAVALVGSDDEKRAYREAVNGAHRHVRSTATSGAHYNAFDPALQLWVTACLYRGFRDVSEWIRPDISDSEKDELYRASVVLGTTLQVRPVDWPVDRAAFAAYWDSVVAHDLRMDDPVRDYLLALLELKNFPLPIRLLFGRFNFWVSTGWLPPEFRAMLGLDWTEQDQRRFVRLNGLLRRVDLALPGPIRRATWAMWLWDLRLRRRVGWKLV